MKANVYVDGFNLYYRAVKGTRYRWLDVRRMCESMFPAFEINRIRYFTANVMPNRDDPGQAQRQVVACYHLTIEIGRRA